MTSRVCRLVLAILVMGGCANGGAEADKPSSDVVDLPGIGQTRIDVPRPTGVASAACDANPLPPASDASIEERVAALRAIGLFADRPELNDAALAAQVKSGIDDIWGDSIESNDRLMDLIVAAEDHQRVWWQDLEADVIDGNDVYVQTLEGWRVVAQGAFEPTGVREKWASAEGPVAISFSLDTKPHEVTAVYFDDWIDPGILGPINELIAPSGRRFELYESFDQTAFVMALTDAEKRSLEAREWCFE